MLAVICSPSPREASLEAYRASTAALLALAAMFATMSAKAQAPDQRTLLSSFCDPADVEGSTCKKAKGYPIDRACDVKLGEERYSGQFLAAGSTLLIVGYESGCEPHANDFGGSVVFEQSGGTTVFKGYQPGYRVKECVVIAGKEKKDRLVCVTGHIGQGYLESGVAEMVFSRDSKGDIELTYDFLVRAVDSIGAHGSNTVRCKERSKYFSLAKLGAGPRPGTVAVDIGYADEATIKTACRKGFPRPKETFGRLSRGEAYVPEGYEKQGRFVIDMATRKVVSEAGVGRPASR